MNRKDILRLKKITDHKLDLLENYNLKIRKIEKIQRENINYLRLQEAILIDSELESNFLKEKILIEKYLLENNIATNICDVNMDIQLLSLSSSIIKTNRKINKLHLIHDKSVEELKRSNLQRQELLETLPKITDAFKTYNKGIHNA